MGRAKRMTRDRKCIIVAHCVIGLWRHYCLGCVEGYFSGYPSHKTYTCQNMAVTGLGQFTVKVLVKPVSLVVARLPAKRRKKWSLIPGICNVK